MTSITLLLPDVDSTAVPTRWFIDTTAGHSCGRLLPCTPFGPVTGLMER
jgi:hypothetical protein